MDIIILTHLYQFNLKSSYHLVLLSNWYIPETLVLQVITLAILLLRVMLEAHGKKVEEDVGTFGNRL